MKEGQGTEEIKQVCWIEMKTEVKEWDKDGRKIMLISNEKELKKREG
jgi:hypothetical protein